jgi:hypothetical protein
MEGIPPGASCSEIETALQKLNIPSSVCRSNSLYNHFFFRCCEAEIPR